VLCTDTAPQALLHMNPSSEDGFNVCSEILRAKAPGSTLLFSTVTGSHQYGMFSTKYLCEMDINKYCLVCVGLAHNSSDIDYAGVYVYDTREFLSITNTLPSAPLGNLPTQEPDYRLYEAKQFVQLLVEGTYQYK